LVKQHGQSGVNIVGQRLICQCFAPFVLGFCHVNIMLAIKLPFFIIFFRPDFKLHAYDTSDMMMPNF